MMLRLAIRAVKDDIQPAIKTELQASEVCDLQWHRVELAALDGGLPRLCASPSLRSRPPARAKQTHGANPRLPSLARSVGSLRRKVMSEIDG
jgi:hypothetical protein